MHWFEQLASLYLPTDIPPHHMIYQTDIEIHLDINGKFRQVRRKRLPTLIPVTEASAYRTSAIEPHPLSDKLRYVISGYGKLNHDAYVKAITEWAESEWSTPRLRAVKDLVISEALPAHLAHITKDGDTAVRFVVDDVPLWEDAELIQAHIDRTETGMNNTGFCCVTGDIVPLCRSHQKHITDTSSSAKLISHEHRSRLIYQGRYSSPNEMFPIGADISFKAHTALRRMIAERGAHLGSKTFVAWDENGSVPLPFSDSELSPSGRVTVIVLTEATKGRLSVTFIRYLSAERYLYASERWRRLGLTPREIALAAFGHRGKNGLRCSYELIGSTAERLLGCILDNTPLPTDILNAVERRSPQTAQQLKNYNAGELYAQTRL